MKSKKIELTQNRILTRIGKFLPTKGLLRQWVLKSDSHALRLLLPQRKLSESEMDALSNHIKLLASAECKVIVKTTKRHISSDCTAIIQFWNGGRLEFQGYLKPQTKFVEKTNFFFEKIH